jgi:hypothetical protein
MRCLGSLMTWHMKWSWLMSFLDHQTSRNGIRVWSSGDVEFATIADTISSSSVIRILVMRHTYMRHKVSEVSICEFLSFFSFLLSLSLLLSRIISRFIYALISLHVTYAFEFSSISSFVLFFQRTTDTSIVTKIFVYVKWNDKKKFEDSYCFHLYLSLC